MSLNLMRNMKLFKGPVPSKPWRKSSSVIIAAPKSKTPSPTELCKGLEVNDNSDYRICMLKRSSKSSFMKNAMVFPGGSFEEVDQRLAVKYGTKPDVLCCLREAFEESGAALLENGESGSREWQEKVQADSNEYEKFINHHNTDPAISKMHYWCSFQTPDGEAARTKKGGFDTTFYLTTTSLTDATSMQCDGKETVSLVWVSPKEALMAYSDGRIWLPPPQYCIMEELLEKPLISTLDSYADSPDRAFIRNHPIKPCMLVPSDFEHGKDQITKMVMAYPGDALHSHYPHPGGLHRLTITRHSVTKLYENISQDLIIPFQGIVEINVLHDTCEVIISTMTTAMHAAMMNGQHEAMRILHRYGADLEERLQVNGWTLLLKAAWCGMTEEVKVLIELGSDLSAVDNFERNVFYCAAWNGEVETMQVLREYNVGPEHRDSTGKTPLHRAALHNDVRTLNILKEWDVNFMIEDYSGRTALSHAIRKSNTETVQFLQQWAEEIPLSHHIKMDIKIISAMVVSLLIGRASLRKYIGDTMHRKTVRNIWRLFGLSVMAIWGAMILLNRDWVLFDMWKNENEGLEMNGLNYFMCYHVAWYTHLTIESVFEYDRLDYVMMMTHHFMSVFLVYSAGSNTSVRLRMSRMAVFIPVLDVSELLILCWKIAYRTKSPLEPHFIFASITSWFLIRVCLAAAMLTSVLVSGPVDKTLLEFLCVGSVGVLYGMNIIWFMDMWRLPNNPLMEYIKLPVFGRHKASTVTRSQVTS